MPQTYVRVPPQSTGSRVSTTQRYLLKYDTLTSPFAPGEIITGAVSGATGTIADVDTEGFGATEGILWLHRVTGTFVNNEQLQVQSVTFALADITSTYPFESYDIQNTIITDPDNPSHKQKIDRFGATLNTFSDGSPSFGAFGTLTVGEPQAIRDYRFAYNGLDSLFSDTTVGAGSISWLSQSGVMLLSTSDANGDSAQRTSNMYHPYQPGVGHSIEMTVRCGDPGKANNVRRWGYFDDNNGVFWELDGTDFYIVLRSNVSGSVVEERIARSSWSKDPLDGSDSIGFDLDVTNPNIYFIDLQWLGAGRVRFGVVEPDGSRLVAHIIENANQLGDFPYMRTASLPVRIENVNTGATSGSSELRMACASIKHASKSLIAGERTNYSSGLKTITAAGGEVPIAALRPKVTFNSLENRGIIKMLAINAANLVKNGGGPVVFRYYQAQDASALTGHAFASANSFSIAELDTSSTALGAAQIMGDYIVGGGETRHIQTFDARELHTLELFLRADNTQPVFVVTAELLSGTDADVYFSVNAEEIKL